MATNPLVKLKRGAYSNLTNYPSVDGQLFFASNSAAQLANAASDSEGYNVIVFDIQDGNSVIRRNVDAYRAIYAQTAGTATTAGKWSSSITFSISDGNNHNGNTVSTDGSSNVALTLPSTITATLDGRAASALKLVTNANADVGAGSATVPVYFSGGVPVACNGKSAANPLDVNISGNAATASIADALAVTNMGSNDQPVYFSSGVPVACTAINFSKVSPTGVLPLNCIPAGALERMYTTSTTNISGLTSGDVQEGDIVKDASTGQLYYVVNKQTTVSTSAGDIEGTNFNFVHFTAGSASEAAHASSADHLASSVTIAISGGATGTATSFDGSSNITIPVTAIAVSNYTENNVTTNVTVKGTLAVNHGGTGKTSWNKGRLIYASTDTTPVLTELANANTTNYILCSGGSDKAPKWVAPTSVSVGEASRITGATINGTTFTGDDNITTAKWGNARTVTISDNDGSNTLANDATQGAKNVIDGSANFTLKLPATIKASLSGNATTATTASALSHTLTIASYNIAGGENSNLTVTYGSASNDNSSFSISPDDLFTVYSVNNVTGSTTAGTWTTVTTPTGMATGTYIVQIHAKAATSSKFNDEYFSGVMSFNSANCASSTGDSDEVLLHACGKNLAGYHVYLRTRRTASGAVVIEMCADVALNSTNDKFDFKFRRMI